MKRAWGFGAFAIVVLVIVWMMLYDVGSLTIFGAGNRYTHIVLLSDLHLPGQNKDQKTKIIDNLNSWGDVGAVAVLGDITQTRGTAAEYEYVKLFFSRLKAPVWPITGNHDFIYADARSLDGRTVRAMPNERAGKLERFKQVFSLDSHYYTKRISGYLLIFLSADDLEKGYLASMSTDQMGWLKHTLAANKQTPTIIFFHAPLKNTYSGNGGNVGKQDFYAQPADTIDDLLKENPQVFLWVSGHVHLAPSHSSFDAAENLYNGKVLTLHNPDLNGSSYLSSKDIQTTKHQALLTNSLFIYPDKISIRMYDHNAQSWLPGERVVNPPRMR